MVPATLVTPSDHTATPPPLPLVMASASIVAPCATLVACAFCCGPAPWKLPPINAVPPPASPDTSIRAPGAKVTLSPSTATWPPVSPAPLPEASSVPDTLVPPPEPDSTIWPLTAATLVASMMPLVLMTFSMTPLAAAAVSSTVPPSAASVPLFSMSARAPGATCSTGAVIANFNSPSPAKSTA